MDTHNVEDLKFSKSNTYFKYRLVRGPRPLLKEEKHKEFSLNDHCRVQTRFTSIQDQVQ